MGRLVQVGTAGIQPSVFVNTNTFTAAEINSDLTLTPNGTGKVTVPGTTASSSTSTGALTIGGGLGVAGNVYGGGNIVITGSGTISSTTASSSTSSGALIVGGGIGAGGNIYNGGNIVCSGNGTFTGTMTVSSSTASSSYTTGALTVAGGVGINGALYVNSTLNCGNDITAWYSSDENLKTNITPIENALDKIEAMGGWMFDWNEAGLALYPERTGRDLGLIAQKVLAAQPELVIKRDNGYLAVNYEKTVALLTQGIVELRAEVKELRKKLGE